MSSHFPANYVPAKILLSILLNINNQAALNMNYNSSLDLSFERITNGYVLDYVGVHSDKHPLSVGSNPHLFYTRQATYNFITCDGINAFLSFKAFSKPYQWNFWVVMS